MSKENNIFVLSDGRKLGYAEYGDPKGKPIFFFHGWPSSRFQGRILDRPGEKLHARIIAIDRPGYGLSTYKNNRTLLDWSDDVEELANKLNIKKFAVMGVSGGGPYAAVCGYKIPERLTKVGIVVGLALTNIKGVLEGMAFLNSLSWRLYYISPFFMQLSSSILFIQAKKLLPEFVTLSLRAKVDQAILSSTLKKDLAEIRLEAFKQGKKGAAMDLRLYTNNWKFALENIKAKVILWYGDADKNVSLAMGKYYASQIKNSKLIVYPKEGHFLMATHAEEILKQLL